MPLWKIKDNKPHKVLETDIKQEELLEEHLEDWIVDDPSILTRELKIAKFEREESLSEKLGLPSSVVIKNVSENHDRVRLRIKYDFNLESQPFLEFLKVAYEACPK